MVGAPWFRDHAGAATTPESAGAPTLGGWERVYEEWRLPVLRFAHRLTGDAHLAEDIVHEAFLRLMSAPDAEVGTLRSPGSWLFRVAANIVRDAGRRDRTRQRAALKIVHDSPAPERPDDALERAEAVTGVRRALDMLGERDREVLLMREGGFSYDEIATVIGIQPQSVPSVVMRALRRFRAAYGAGEAS